MKEIKIVLVVGARPNFIKISPLIKEINKYHNINHKLIHTGQHYDDRMSNIFFESLDIPQPDVNLNIGGDSSVSQIANTMLEFEKFIEGYSPDWVIVVGDVNATIACSLVANKMKIKLCHIEAGIRSGDKSMPEEINRIVTDSISDLLLTPDNSFSYSNLDKEGIESHKYRFVGNIMIDTLEQNLEKSKNLKMLNIIKNNIIKNQAHNDSFDNDPFAIITMHRPANVDSKEKLKHFLDFFIEFSSRIPLVWPVHPRCKNKLINYNFWDKLLGINNILLLNPIGYHEMLKINMESQLIFTDSGGLQEESLILGTPCLTMRSNTERPITLEEYGGTSYLVGDDIDLMWHKSNHYINWKPQKQRPKYWDGKTSKRCIDAVLNYSKDTLAK